MWMHLRRSICFINTSYERLPNVPSVRQMWMWSSPRKPSGVGMLQSLPHSVPLSYLCLRVTCLATAHSVLVIVSLVCLNVKFVAKLWCIIKIFCLQCAGFLWCFFFLPSHRNIVKGMRSLREILRTVETKATQTLKMVRGMNGWWEGGVICYAGIMSVY